MKSQPPTKKVCRVWAYGRRGAIFEGRASLLARERWCVSRRNRIAFPPSQALTAQEVDVANPGDRWLPQAANTQVAGSSENETRKRREGNKRKAGMTCIEKGGAKENGFWCLGLCHALLFVSSKFTGVQAQWCCVVHAGERSPVPIPPQEWGWPQSRWLVHQRLGRTSSPGSLRSVSCGRKRVFRVERLVYNAASPQRGVVMGECQCSCSMLFFLRRRQESRAAPGGGNNKEKYRDSCCA